MRRCSPYQLRKIIELTSNEFKVPLDDILSRRRTRSMIPARHIAMWLCKHYTAASYPQIADVFGGMNHTSIMHGSAAADAMLHNNDELALKALFVATRFREWKREKAGN